MPTHRLQYLRAYYCLAWAPHWLRPVAVAVLAAWTLLLFFVMAQVAEHFLCPSVEVRWG
jgi:hypothetical protein